MNLSMNTHDEDTLFKVQEALQAVEGLDGHQIQDAITEMQNRGILFREAVIPDSQAINKAVQDEKDRQPGLGYDAEHDDLHTPLDFVNLVRIYFGRGQIIKGLAVLQAFEEYLKRNPRPKVNPMQEDVHTMMGLYEQNRPTWPQLANPKDAQLRINLMIEELLGAENPDDPIYGNPGDVLAVKGKSDELVASIIKGDLVGIADGIGDVLTVVFGTAVAYGINAQEVFDEVHRSNMTKAVWSEEEQRYILVKNEDGKVIKPDSYSPADVEAVVLRQILENAPEDDPIRKDEDGKVLIAELVEE